MATEDKNVTGCRSILIIDDDKIFCNLLKTLLNKIFSDITVGIYDVGIEGVPDEHYGWSEYDLLIMDYNLGGGHNGVDWLRKFKNQSGFPPVIILTAQGNEDLIVEVMQAGARDYINKQKLSLERLSNAIRKAVGDRDVHQEKPAIVPIERSSMGTSMQTVITSKGDFYKKMDDLLKSVHKENNPYLFQVEVNDYQKIQAADGLLCADEYITRITELLAGFLQGKHLQFNLAQIGDSKIAGLITEYDNDAGKIEKIADSMCTEISYKIPIKDKEVESTIAVGIVMVISGEKLDTLFDKADSVCQKISDKGKNNYQIMDISVALEAQEEVKEDDKNESKYEEKEAANEEDRAKEGKKIDIAKAIKKNRLQTYYQSFIPLSKTALNLGFNYSQVQIDIQDEEGNSYSLEVLKVMDNEDKFRANLDLWIIGHAIGEIIKLKDKNKKLKLGLFIGLSREALTSSLLINWLKELINKSDIKMIKSILIFEIHSTDFMDEQERLVNLMQYLRDKIDVKFSVYEIIDESILKSCMDAGQFEFVRFPMDEEKIDEIRKLGIMAKDLGASIIMDKAHEAEHLNLVIDLGADYCQGNFVQPATKEIIISEDDPVE